MPHARRIAIVIDSLAGGGAERVMLRLIGSLTEAGHKIHLISLKDRVDYPVPDDIHFSILETNVRHRTSRKRIQESRRRLAALLRGHDGSYPDLTLANLDRSHKLMCEMDVPNCHFVIHNSIKGTQDKLRIRRPIRYLRHKLATRRLNGKNVVCVSQGIANEIAKDRPFQPNTCRTIYNPLDLSSIREQSLRAETGIPKEPYFIHVGRFARQKRHDRLMKVIARFRSVVGTASTPKFVCLSDHPAKVLELAKLYGVAAHVASPGFQSNPFPWMRQAQAMVLTSDHEGLPTVLIESIACGTPVVSVDCPHGPREILTGPLRRFLTPLDDIDGLVRNLIHCSSEDVDLSNVAILKKSDSAMVAKSYLKLSENPGVGIMSCMLDASPKPNAMTCS